MPQVKDCYVWSVVLSRHKGVVLVNAGQGKENREGVPLTPDEAREYAALILSEADDVERWNAEQADEPAPPAGEG